MTKTKVTKKGEISVPAEVREKLGLHPGDEIEFEETKEGYIIRKKPKESPFDQWVGYLKHKRDQDPDEMVRELRGHE